MPHARGHGRGGPAVDSTLAGGEPQVRPALTGLPGGAVHRSSTPGPPTQLAACPETLGEEFAHLRVDYDGDGEPILLGPDGSVLDTWREGYPYDERMTREEYDRTKRLLQIELLKLQSWMKESGQRLAIVFEGRDAAGKGGTIKRFTEHLNPRGAHVVALARPSERERGQWYFQRYVSHLPTAGEIVLFDRSWYNRAGVERVMGFATPTDYLEFMREVPDLERMWVRSGIHLVKLWFSVSRNEQRTRFLLRQLDPVRQWKLSSMDLESLDKWDAYTEAKEAMFFHTDTADAPWTVVKSNDKKRGRIEAMRHVLARFDYPEKDYDVVGTPDPRIVGPARDVFEVEEESSPLRRWLLPPGYGPAADSGVVRGQVAVSPQAGRDPMVFRRAETSVRTCAAGFTGRRFRSPAVARR